MNKVPENRKYKRIEKPYVIRFRIKPYETQYKDITDWDMVAVNNLGAGGIYFHAGRSLKIGTILDLKIGFSLFSSCINCVGRVARVKGRLDTSIFGIAIEFTEIDDHIRAMLNKTALVVHPDV